MPRVSKKRQAAKNRYAMRKLACLTGQVLPNPFGQPAGSGPWIKLPPEEEEPIPTEPTVDIHVKQELLELDANPFAPEHLEEEIKVEVLEPTETEPDPIGELQLDYAEDRKPLDDLPAITLAEPEPPTDITCHFCLKQFRDTVGRGIITRKRIAFVLGVRKWGPTHQHLDCCKDCKKMFDLFYDFKRSCLAALARPLFLLSCTKKEVSTEVIDLRPKNVRMKKRKQPKPESPPALPPSSNDNSDVEVDDEQVNPDPPDDVDGTMTDQSTTEEIAPNESEENTNQPKKRRKYCYRCKEFYETEALYLEHKPTCTKPARDPPPLECSLCARRFTRPDKLMYHMNKHNGVRTVPCRREGCTKMFFDTNNRHNHEQHCGQDVQVICSICGAIFRSKGALRAHMPSHGEPTVVCEVCNKAFHTRAKLKKHMSVHSEERRFQCKVCGKRFKSHEANRVHQRIHTQEKPYICHICGMAFTYNCLLKTHLERGHEVVDSAQRELMQASRALEMAGGGY